MAEPEKGGRPIIIIKRRKAGGAGHHGGAWKVAYADFVTAMMAFFLVLWLVSSISKEQRAAVFEYFKNPSMEPGKSQKPAPGQMGPGGASTSVINLRGGLDSPRSTVSVKDRLGSPVEPPSSTPPNGKTSASDAPDVAEAHRIAEADEARKLESLMLDLRQAISQSQALEPFKDQLLLDITPEGLRIQIVDQQNRAMFDLGSSRLKDYTDRILEELAVYLNSVPNRISVTGHTDITPYTGRSDYSNWELSADRANAARRALLKGGLHPEKIARVVGLSSAVLFDKERPNDPVNRRISIVVMTKRAEEAALRTDEMPQNVSAPEPAAESTATAAAAGAATASGAAPVSGAGTTSGAGPLAAGTAGATASTPAGAAAGPPIAGISLPPPLVKPSAR